MFNPEIKHEGSADDKEASKKKEEDDGDFDDDDDEEDEDAGLFKDMLGIDDGKRRLKKSNYQMLGCGAKGMIPSKIKANQERVDQLSKQIVDFVTGQFKHMGTVPLGESYQLKCAGIAIHRPKVRFESNRIVVGVQLNKDSKRPENYCDDEQ